jgi:hypothetical protein
MTYGALACHTVYGRIGVRSTLWTVGSMLMFILIFIIVRYSGSKPLDHHCKRERAGRCGALIRNRCIMMLPQSLRIPQNNSCQPPDLPRRTFSRRQRGLWPLVSGHHENRKGRLTRATDRSILWLA